MSNPGSIGYRPSLDGIRAVGVALVVLYHYNNGTPSGGWLGVDLFFVLSGFLITTLLLEERAAHGRISLLRFYQRRALRLLPALWVLLATYLVVLPFTAEPLNAGLRQAAYGFTYTMNIALALGARTGSHLQPLWSLGLEEQFYVLWPLIMIAALVSRRGVTRMFLVAAAITVALGAVRLGLQHRATTDISVLRFDQILVGCMFALVRRAHAQRFERIVGSSPVTLLALAVTLWLVMRAYQQDVVFVAHEKALVFACAGGVLVAGCTVSNGSRVRTLLTAILATRPFVFLGRISYALYLWHMPIFLWLGASTTSGYSRVGMALLALFISLVVATLSYYVVERPFLRRKWRLARTRSHDADVAATHAHRALIDGADPSQAV